MRVYVAGGRRYGERPADVMLLHHHLDGLHGSEARITEIVTGGQGKYDPDLRKWLGADYWGAQWAVKQGVPYITLKARWQIDGKAAGILRTTKLLEVYPPQVVVLTRGDKGTAHAEREAERLGYIVEHVADE